jgi:HEAT repeat protein
MLEELDQVDWTLYSHAYGPATDLADLIRRLVITNNADDKADQAAEDTLEQLYGMIWHQGTVYSATAIAVPFLIDIVTHNISSHTVGILNLLSSCATGSGYFEVHGSMDDYRDRRDTEAFQATVREELENVNAAYKAVVAGLPVYITLLNDAHSDIREAAAELIALCGPRMESAVPALKARIAIEQTHNTPESREITATLVGQLGYLLTHPGGRAESIKLSEEDQSLFVSWLSDPSFPQLARIAAAQTLIDYGNEVSQALGLDFIKAIPDVPAVPLDYRLHGLIQTLTAHNVEMTVEWIARMVDYEDQATVEQLPYLMHSLYATYRQDVKPLLKILLALLRKDVASVLLWLSGFRRMSQTTREVFEEMIDMEVDIHMKQALRHKAALLIRPDDVPFVTPLEDFLRPAVWSMNSSSLEQLLLQIETGFKRNDINEQIKAEWLKEIVKYGSAALADERTLPILIQSFTHNHQWVRVYAARTLALLAPDYAWDTLRDVLTEELRGRPAGLVVMDTLIQLAESGFDVTWALPQLEIFANSPIRRIEMGAMGSIPAEDEQLQTMAQKTIAAIRKNT